MLFQTRCCNIVSAKIFYKTQCSFGAILEFASLGAPLESFWPQGKEDSSFRKSGIRTQNLGITDRHDLNCSNTLLPNSLRPKICRLYIVVLLVAGTLQTIVLLVFEIKERTNVFRRRYE